MASLATLERVTYTYPQSPHPALRDVDLDIGPAEVILIVGGSGSGKSTLLRCLNGLVPHFHGGTFGGRVTVHGFDTRTTASRRLAEHVGLVFQDPESQAVMTTVEHELAFGLENTGVCGKAITRLVEEALISTGLSHLRHAPLSELSGGELQRVALAAVIAMQPDLLLLDEPTSQLDPVSSEDLLASVRRLSEDTGATIVLAEHRVERCLHLATRVVAMEGGVLIRDDTPEAFARWAKTHNPGWLTPVGRLFGRRPSGRTSRAGDDIAAPTDSVARSQSDLALPCTVKQAREQLGRGDGCRPVRLQSTPSQRRGAVILRATGLTIGYDPEVPLLEDLHLTLHRGEIIALMGENGVGKSTLVKHFNGLLRPQRGSVELAGLDLARLPVSAAARHCAYLGQNPGDYFVKESVGAEIEYSLEALGIAAERRAELRERVTDDLDLRGLLARDPRELSGGERTRAALATVVCGEPPLLVLDEPTRGMDPHHKADLAARLDVWARRDRCILVVTHDVEFAARAASRIVILGTDGILADGSPPEVLDGALFFTTQVNRLLRDAMPGVLLDEQVAWEAPVSP